MLSLDDRVCRQTSSGGTYSATQELASKQAFSMSFRTLANMLMFLLAASTDSVSYGCVYICV